jgi:hypothetical protein
MLWCGHAFERLGRKWRPDFDAILAYPAVDSTKYRRDAWPAHPTRRGTATLMVIEVTPAVTAQTPPVAVKNTLARTQGGSHDARSSGAVVVATRHKLRLFRSDSGHPGTSLGRDRIALRLLE